jgi:ribosomal protein S18 acetylase RimI-like enzyme
VLVRRLQAGELDLVAPVWESLLAHHAAVAPAMPTRPPDESWRMRRADYVRWLAEPDAFALVAEEGGAVVGYAVVRLGGPDETWVTGERSAELETLAVLPTSRGQGVGAALMDAVDEEIRRLGVDDLWVSVVAGNDGALRFYERRGLATYMNRMHRGRIAGHD